MSTTLPSFISALREAFGRGSDKHGSHHRARQVLLDMAAAPAVFTEILEKHLAGPEAFAMKHYPVVSLEVETNANFGLVANCWIPLPNGDTNMSTKAIHHHGTMLLTTATAFGPGYEHWMFSTPEPVAPESEMFTMRLLERAPHPTGHAAFVDANIGHVPFFPASLTITFALWSSREPTSWKDALKRVPALHKHSQTLRAVARKAGLARALDLKVVRYFDFHPVANGFRGMKDRTEFSRGPNEDYLCSLFHLIQRTGNDALAPLIRRRLELNPGPNPGQVAELLSSLENGRPIEGKLSQGHYDVPFANFPAEEIERALAVCGAPTAASLSRTR